MGFAISLRSDHPSADSVRALWRDIERFEDRPSMALLGYPPHITLAIYDDDAVGEEDVRKALDLACRGLDALTVTFDAIRTFDGSPMVLWLSPRPEDRLENIHRHIHSAIDPRYCRPHYRPGAWRPHCTLGTRIIEQRREAAIQYASDCRKTFQVTFDALDCIFFPPIAPLDMRRLSPD